MKHDDRREAASSAAVVDMNTKAADIDPATREPASVEGKATESGRCGEEAKCHEMSSSYPSFETSSRASTMLSSMLQYVQPP